MANTFLITKEQLENLADPDVPRCAKEVVMNAILTTSARIYYDIDKPKSKPFVRSENITKDDAVGIVLNTLQDFYNWTSKEIKDSENTNGRSVYDMVRKGLADQYAALVRTRREE